jgi:pYEATS domain-containing protein involved in immunity
MTRHYRALVWLSVGLFLAIAVLFRTAWSDTPPSFTPNAPKITNYARFETEMQGVPFFRWRVFLDEPPEVLETIAEVHYELHPSFNEPSQVRRDASTKFSLERGGWGEFRIPVTIRYKDGRVLQTAYRLDFRKPWPPEIPESSRYDRFRPTLAAMI